MADQHSGAGQNRCSKCNQTFGSAEELRKHEQQQHQHEQGGREHQQGNEQKQTFG